MRVFLVGVNHRIQYLRDSEGPQCTEEVRGFEQYLAQQCQTHQIQLLAEEFSDEACILNEVRESTVERVAATRGIRHRFCDPGSEQRNVLNIPPNDVQRREEFWLDCLLDAQKTPILFVCGDKHVDSFRGLLQQSGHEACILDRNSWGYGWELKD